MQIPISTIIIDEDRQRQFHDQKSIERLAYSIRTFGLMQPIVVERLDSGMFKLIAGERRLLAHKHMNLKEIEATLYEDLTEFTRQSMEFQENACRENLTPEEEVFAKERLHKLMISHFGEGFQSGDDRSKPATGWTVEKTAEMLGSSKAGVSQDLKVAEALHKDPTLVDKYGNKTAIYKAITAKESRAVDEVLAMFAAKEVKESGDSPIEIRLGDSTVELKNFPDSSVDLIITDPPYGVDFDEEYRQERSWKEQTFKDNIDSLRQFQDICVEMFRILKPSGHIYIFFAMANYTRFKDIIETSGFNLRPIPIIWTKDGRVQGPLARTPYSFAHWYEPIFFATKGSGRVLNEQNIKDVIDDCPPPKDRSHPTEKPVELIRKLMLWSSFKDELILDPYAGSGVVARAAQAEGRRAIVVEKDAVMWNKAQEKFKESLNDPTSTTH